MSIKTPTVITIGQHVLPARAVLAPMSGVTDHGMRRAAERFGAGMVVSEMVAADQLAIGDEEARLRSEGEGLSLHVVQLAGCEAHAMAEGARVAEASGAHVIDINMGCPAKRVTNGWSGSALMRDLDHAQTLIDAVRGAVKVPVTLKMRLGWDHASLNAPELARRCEDSGLSLVTVHGRTRQQFYKGEADWSAVQAVRAATRLPLLVNGDIGSLEAAQAALLASGADGVMIGRAATGRPWLVGEIGRALDGKPAIAPDLKAYGEAAQAHYASLLSVFGEKQGLRHARKHVAAYADEAARLGQQVCPSERSAMLISEAPDAVMAYLGRLFLAISDVAPQPVAA
jgi:tRNA-dihydrouridine synthase B